MGIIGCTEQRYWQLVQGKVAYFKDLTGKLRVITRLTGTEIRTWYKPKPVHSVSRTAWSCLSPSVDTWCDISLSSWWLLCELTISVAHSPQCHKSRVLHTGPIQDWTTTTSATLNSGSQEREHSWLLGSLWKPGLGLCVSFMDQLARLGCGGVTRCYMA